MPTLTFKVSTAEARIIRQAAHGAKTSVSAFLRSRVLDESASKTRTKRVIRRHPVSGARIDATPGPTVTQTQIDAALADFP